MGCHNSEKHRYPEGPGDLHPLCRTVFWTAVKFVGESTTKSYPRSKSLEIAFAEGSVMANRTTHAERLGSKPSRRSL